jgi:6-phosphofructokinase 1
VAKKNPEDAPHLIYVPEKPVSKTKFLADVEITKNKYGWCSIVVGEGARWDDGTYVSAPEQEDKHGNPELGAMGGTSAALNMHKMISNKYGWRGEFQIVESLAMCAIDRASKTDLYEAYQCGVHAVIKAHDESKTAIMVTIDRVSNSPYTVKFGEAPLNEVAVDAKEMPSEFLNEEGNFVTEAFLEYIKPLVDEPAPFSVLTKVTAEV